MFSRSQPGNYTINTLQYVIVLTDFREKSYIITNSKQWRGLMCCSRGPTIFASHNHTIHLF